MLRSGNRQAAGKSSRPICITNVAGFLERAQSYDYILIETERLGDTRELKKIEKE